MAVSDDTDFVISRVFNARRQRVWDAWTKPEMLALWFGPKGTTTTVLHSDLRTGGVVHFRIDTADGGRMWGKFVYREIEAPSRLVWVHSFADEQARVVRSPFGNSWPLELLTTVLFEEAGQGTRVTLTWSPIQPTPEELKSFTEAKPSMREGWGGSVEKLEKLLAAPD